MRTHETLELRVIRHSLLIARQFRKYRMNNHEHELLRAASKVVAIAGVIVGEDIGRSHKTCRIEELPHLLEQLRNAVDIYNSMIYAMMIHE
jgi:hypothetical protein